MADSQKFVLMLQPNRFQGFIWKAILKSQQISVIWEAPDTDLKDNLTQLGQAGLTLPHLLIVDMQCLGDNPYAFCRWCRDNYPGVKIILTNCVQRDIAGPERDWAVHQGASDLLPGFQRDNLVSSATTCVKRALDVLEHDDMNDGALISVLLKLRRELEARQSNSANGSHGMDNSSDMDAANRANTFPGNQAGYPMQPNTSYGMYAQQSPQPYNQNQPVMGQPIPGQPISAQQMPMQPMNGHTAQGHPMNGQMMNGQVPMQSMNGQMMNGQYMPGQSMPGQQVPMQSMSGQMMNGQYMPGQSMPGQSMPGQQVPGQQRPGQGAGMNGYPPQNSQPGQPGQPNSNQSEGGEDKKFRRRYRGAWY